MRSLLRMRHFAIIVLLLLVLATLPPTTESTEVCRDDGTCYEYDDDDGYDSDDDDSGDDSDDDDGVNEDGCADSNDECPQWAKDGECNKNPKYMLDVCPRSCSACDGGLAGSSDACTNKNAKCPKWANQGECDKNPKYMLKECALSCGACGGQASSGAVCEDKNDQCQMWANSGECEKNPKFVLKECPRSCGECDSFGACKDVDRDCPERAAKGECMVHEKIMRKRCRESCFLCVNEEKLEGEELIRRKRRMKMETGPVQRIDGTKDEREKTKERLGEIDRYLREELISGKYSDKALRDCENSSTWCAFWAGKGRCDDRKEFMLKQCPLACLACEDDGSVDHSEL